MAVKVAMRVLGFMSGTSLDAVDMALLETDGRAITAWGPAGERKLGADTRAIVQTAIKAAFAWGRGETEPAIFAEAARAVTMEHADAAREFLARHDVAAADLDLIGFHGQTVLHERPTSERIGRTVQLGDGALLARELGAPVVFDFRTADVASGGQGAPLAPIYHSALVRASKLELPVMVLNLGGVGNVTLVTRDEAQMQAFDTGPANGMIDLLVQSRTPNLRCDEGGRLAAAGTPDMAVVRDFLSQAYFAAAGPKSLDRYDFSIEAVAHLALEDAAATLTLFAAQAVALGVAACEPAPTAVIVCGGGRCNPSLMARLREAIRAPVMTAEEIGWRGDSIEAEAFAYLAARARMGLPISFPGTTGVAAPLTGGRLAEPEGVPA